MVKKAQKVLLILLVIVLINVNIPIAYGANDSVIGTYSGSTTASSGYKPNCTFMIIKVVGNKFRGTFSAQNIAPYSFTENVSGLVTRGEESFTCFF